MRGLTRFCAGAARYLGFGALAIIVLATLGYAVGVIPLRPAMLGVVIALFAGLLAVLTGLIAFLFGGKYEARFRRLGLTGLVVGALAAAVPAYWLTQTRGIPAIHDISTDTADPPAFVDIVPLRADAPNPVAYAGVEAAREQSVAYPDVQPIEYAGPPEQAYERAIAVVSELGWTLQGQDPTAGRIEATDTTTFFRFKDDIVIRIRPAQGGTSRVDIRSKSRVGMGDLGVNANRIRAFRDRLLANA